LNIFEGCDTKLVFFERRKVQVYEVGGLYVGDAILNFIHYGVVYSTHITFNLRIFFNVCIFFLGV